jgi:hypothetical protein
MKNAELQEWRRKARREIFCTIISDNLSVIEQIVVAMFIKRMDTEKKRDTLAKRLHEFIWLEHETILKELNALLERNKFLLSAQLKNKGF